LVSNTNARHASEISVVRQAFDAEFYLARNPDVKEKGLDPVQHYVQDGWRNGLNPNSEFDTTFYLAENPDVAADGVNPFYHYLMLGKAEGRFPNEQAMAIAGYGLHSKDEPRHQDGQLYSKLDFRSSIITCDECGNWQRLRAFTEFDGRKEADVKGWKIVESRDLCPECVRRDRIKEMSDL
jgi:hypothetical protein